MLKAEDAAGLCRGFNEELAKLVTDHPTRFGALATIPLPDIAASLKEIAYAADQLNADGFVLMSNYNGMYPGDPEFSPVLEELNGRKAVVFLHPTETIANNELTFGYPAPMVEYLAETPEINSYQTAAMFQKHIDKEKGEPQTFAVTTRPTWVPFSNAFSFVGTTELFEEVNQFAPFIASKTSNRFFHV